jgi:hypothetical protein
MVNDMARNKGYQDALETTIKKYERCGGCLSVLDVGAGAGLLR